MGKEERITVILCYFHRKKKIPTIWKNKHRITEAQNGLEDHPGLEKKTKNKTKQKHPNTTNYVTIIPKGQQDLPTGDTPHEEYLQTSQVLLLPTGHDLWQSYLKLQIWLHSVDYKHFTLLVKLLVLLATTMFCVLRFCDDGLKKKRVFFLQGC